MICILGSTGQLGLPLTKQLVAARQSVRCLAHTEKSAEILRQEVPEVDIVVGDMTDRDDLRRAMDGCDQLFIVTPVVDTMVAMQKQIIDVAAEGGIRGITKLSGYTADHVDEISLLSQDHGATDRYIAEAGVPYTLLYPCTFMQTLILQFSDSVKKESKIVAPVTASNTISFVDGRDVVDTAAAVLIKNKHDNEIVFITGPEPVSYGQVAEKLSERLGRPITYEKNTFDESQKDLLAVGLNAYGAEALRGLYEMYERGDMNDIGDGVMKTTGHEPRSIDDFLDAHIALFA
ncbi:NmrA family NAD(P)-binding protein [Tsukamurella tyrosinosolvens]|uniref:NmrA family NAD(P)-binding protein n=1 Tax=Tsukamurella tyrosinosolvens TaxID=57704 RepID=UPI000799F7FD|nr:NmrA family NAD(P)-binding protein [Tsukamurella tyrosinosolvens]KXP08414.1 hypothetical protein AXK59_23730 [Tsukamurella tyrosinosolvens]